MSSSKIAMGGFPTLANWRYCVRIFLGLLKMAFRALAQDSVRIDKGIIDGSPHSAVTHLAQAS